MRLQELESLELPPTADLHVHLRQDPLVELIVPQLRRGGVDMAFVMPNLVPPITSVAQAVQYRDRLQQLEPCVKFLMSLYLHSSITPDVISEAAEAGITGVKCYPQGVTTNSESGVTRLDDFYPVFAAMEKHNLVLNLHGEVTESFDRQGLTHEEAFLPTLITLHQKFPNLRIVLEHCTTVAAVAAVRACGPSVAGTITAHHLYLTSDDCCDPLAFCKPIPKQPVDRDALVRAICGDDSKFFFGSDSAPHLLSTKRTGPGAPVPAGVFTQPYATQLVILALGEAIERGVIPDDYVTQQCLENFLSRTGRRFYQLPDPSQEIKIVLEKKGEIIPSSIQNQDCSLEVGISRAGSQVLSLRWSMT